MKILTIVDFYLPGYRAGGPMRTICNMVEILGDEHEFLIFTRDRDFGDQVAYNNISTDVWSKNGKANVFYATPKNFSPLGMRRLLNQVEYDVLYLNSYFSPRATCAVLLLRHLSLISPVKIIIAPRGEFSSGALKIKWLRKKLYIYFTKLTNLYSNLYWQASSIHELHDISSVMGSLAKKVFVAPDLVVAPPLKSNEEQNILESNLELNVSVLKIIFISRIDPKKNLDFLLNLLLDANVPISLSIYGPIGNNSYWERCLKLIELMPESISVSYFGDVNPCMVPEVFSQNDVFFFPTLGENFGHVIFESLLSGTPVVISDQTPWESFGCDGIEIIPLVDRENWLASIRRWAHSSRHDISMRRLSALNYAKKYLKEDESINLNRDLFREIASD
jgi:glycosyltransferase involved in cell wall biosynthesis